MRLATGLLIFSLMAWWPATALGDPLPDGSACNVDLDCLSGFCTDGFCCNTVCDSSELCSACNVPGDEGFCTAIPDGQDPADECPGLQVCDGTTQCREGPFPVPSLSPGGLVGMVLLVFLAGGISFIGRQRRR